MKTINNILTLTKGIGIVAVLGAMFVALWDADSLIVRSTPKKALDTEGINNLVPQVKNLLASAQTDVDVAAWKINGDGGSPEHPHTGSYDGILTQLYKNEKTIHKTIFDVDQEQLKLYRQLNADSPALFLKLNSSAGHLDDTLKQFPDTVIETRLTIEDIGKLVTTLNKMGIDLDEHLIKDPEVKEALVQAAGFLKELNLTAEDVRLIMDKVQNDYTAPRTKKGWALVVLRSIVELGVKGAEFKVFLGK